MACSLCVPTPFECKNIMNSRTIFCSAQASTIRLARTGPMPSTSRRRPGSVSIVSNTFSPNARTSFFAYAGPTPGIIPEPRYFSIPSIDVGADPELLPVRAVVDPFACHGDPLARRNRRRLADDSHEIAMPARLCSEHAEPVLLIVEGDPLDQAG